MKNELNIWVVGGDMRQAKLAEQFADDGHTVHTFALEWAPEPILGAEQAEDLEGAALADCVVLPLPVTGEGSLLNAPLSAGRHTLVQVLDALRPGQVVCAGKVGDEARSLAAKRGLTLQDYFAREELAVANAVPTVEGAIQIAMEELPSTLPGKVAPVTAGRSIRTTIYNILNELGV